MCICNHFLTWRPEVIPIVFFSGESEDSRSSSSSSKNYTAPEEGETVQNRITVTHFGYFPLYGPSDNHGNLAGFS